MMQNIQSNTAPNMSSIDDILAQLQASQALPISTPDAGSAMMAAAGEYPALAEGMQSIGSAYQPASDVAAQFNEEANDMGLEGMSDIAAFSSPAVQEEIQRYAQMVRDAQMRGASMPAMSMGAAIPPMPR